MSRRCPVGFTCPLIDTVISFLQESEGEHLVATMEKIRTANDQLRTWGKEEADRVDDLEGEVENLESDVSDLEDKVQELTEQLKEYEQ